ncbi:DUF503 domain-containing protein [Clostridium intestinale]|uniref:DUF503 domain-containing protein n=1 Tax=Clostridium intestinale TaxID=36845 RepID=UPI001FACA0BC|nr:DUF503 domain-containing protein [Clostridium intestinale]
MLRLIIGTAEIVIRISWANSLKEKRMVSRSILAKIKNKFNVSVAEIENMDEHKKLTIGLCCVSNSTNKSNEIINEVINFIYDNTEGEVIDVFTEI